MMTVRAATLLSRVAPRLAENPDSTLVEQFVAGGGEAFAELVRRHGPMVLGVCERVTGNRHDAEDAFQVTFLVLARKARNLTGVVPLGGWLYGVARRAALKARAAAARRRQQEAAAARPASAQPLEHATDWLTVIEEELSRLPERYRQALLLCGVCGQSRRDAARQLGIPEGTLASRLATARAMLAGQLRRRGVVVPAGLLATVLTTPSLSASLVEATTRVATGTVPADIARLATEVTRAMLLTNLHIGVLCVPLALVLAAVVAGASARPETPPPADTKAPPWAAAPAAPIQETAWKKDFDTTYSLKDGEVLKRIAPPFPDCRAEFIKMVGWNGDIPNPPPIFMTFRIQKAPNDKPRNWGMAGGEVSIRNVLSMAVLIPMLEVEGENAVLDHPVGGDFVYRDEASVEERVAAFNRILRDECKLAIKLTFKEVDREVVVARGTLKITPLAGQKKNHVEVFGKELGKGEAWNSRRDLDGFLLDLGGFLGRRIVNEAKSGKEDIFTYGLSVRQDPRLRLASEFDFTAPSSKVDPVPVGKFDLAIEAEDRDPKLVLPNVAKQIGLTFTIEKRKVRVLFVEAVGK
jgi:RNA polymerase sigma factor (sigma-70 family)